MKYCVNVLQPPRILREADEIWVELKSWEAAYDIKHDYPEAQIIIYVPKYAQLIDIPYKDLVELNAIVEFESTQATSLINECLNHDVRYFFKQPVCTWYQLKSIMKWNICAMRIGAPLFFELPAVKEEIGDGVEIRMCPNYIKEDKYADGLHNAWIRPEDAHLYEGIISVFDFSQGPLGSAAARMKIYKEGNWPGNLALLIDNLNIHVDNRIVPPEFGPSRLNCRQRCMCPTNGIHCDLCDIAIDLCKAMRDAFYASGGKIDEQETDE